MILTKVVRRSTTDSHPHSTTTLTTLKGKTVCSSHLKACTADNFCKNVKKKYFKKSSAFRLYDSLRSNLGHDFFQHPSRSCEREVTTRNGESYPRVSLKSLRANIYFGWFVFSLPSLEELLNKMASGKAETVNILKHSIMFDFFSATS